MKRIYTAASLPEAHLLLHALECSGVNARVFNENAQGAVGELPVTYPEIWIEHDRDEVRARAVIEQFERRNEPEKLKNCLVCGEQSPDTFEVCWRCAADLSTS